ncbi:MAG: dihydrodipicolinate synthase family protein [Pseudomonadota bacterium]
MDDFNFRGVIPAITTPFKDNFEIDHDYLREHVVWLAEHGIAGIVPVGSLGEGSSMSFDEKCAVFQSCVEALGTQTPVMATIASATTAEAVALVKRAADIGCQAAMVLPPYVYKGQWHETKAHISAAIEATDLPCMVYNNPTAYGTDILPKHIAELAGDHDNLLAVKESSGDARRFAAIREVTGDRLSLFAGLDDVVCEAVALGASGWIAGLVNALPRQTMDLFNFAAAGETERAFEIYRWFLPLLRLDTVPEFVQLIKLVQAEVGKGSEVVRPPRLPLPSDHHAAALNLIRERLSCMPASGEGQNAAA